MDNTWRTRKEPELETLLLRFLEAGLGGAELNPSPVPAYNSQGGTARGVKVIGLKKNMIFSLENNGNRTFADLR